METEQADGLVVTPSQSTMAASAEASNHRRRLRQPWLGAYTDECRQVLHWAGSLLAALLSMLAGQTGSLAANISADPVQRASHRLYARDVEARHLIDFGAIGRTPVFGLAEQVAGLEGPSWAGVDDAFHWLGELKGGYEPSMDGLSRLQMDHATSALCADRQAGWISLSPALPPSSFGPALSWLDATASATLTACQNAIPVWQQSSTMLLDDVVQPGADRGPTTLDLVQLALVAVDDIWTVRQDLSDPRLRADGSVVAAKQRLPRLASLSGRDRNGQIARAAFPNPSIGDPIERRSRDPFSGRTVLPRPAVGSPIVPRGQRRVRASLDEFANHPAGIREVDALTTFDPPSLVFRDVVQETREKALAFDNGWILANRLKVPLGRLSFSRQSEDTNGGAISLVPFLDTGTVWNTEAVTYPIASDPFGIGAGIGWQITDSTDVRLGIDIPVGGEETEGADDPSQLGFQFRLATTLGN